MEESPKLLWCGQHECFRIEGVIQTSCSSWCGRVRAPEVAIAGHWWRYNHRRGCSRDRSKRRCQDIGIINADTGRHRVSLPEPLKEAVCAVSTEYSCYAGRLSGLTLCGSCSGYHSCYEFVISVVQLWPEDSVLPEPITLMISVFSSVLAWGRVCDIDVPFVTEHSTDTLYTSVSLIFLCQQLWLVTFYINSCLLHKWAPQMRSQSCTNLWV